MARELSEWERRVLRFAAEHPDAVVPTVFGRWPDERAVEIRMELGCHVARFHQTLNWLCRDGRAVARYPRLCRRRREFLERRAAARR